MNRFIYFGKQRRQQGVSLFAAMIFLIALSLLAIVSVRGVIMQERMGGNTQDWNVAFQSAEAALRDAEAELQSATSRINGEEKFAAYPNCIAGRCLPSTTGDSVWRQLGASSNTDWLGKTSSSSASDTAVAASVKYGAFTSVLPLVSPGSVALTQPRYFIENLGVVGSSSLTVSGYGSPAPTYYGYRITAIGFGLIKNDDGSPASKVVLQSVYQR